MPRLPDKDAPTDEQIVTEAWKAVEFLREACPLSYRLRDILVKPKLKNALAELSPVPDADGGPVADIILARFKLGKNWPLGVWTRVFHEWMELALYAQHMAITASACTAVANASGDLCESASVIMESMARKIFALIRGNEGGGLNDVNRE